MVSHVGVIISTEKEEMGSIDLGKVSAKSKDSAHPQG
jgi:hypothetical protein